MNTLIHTISSLVKKLVNTQRTTPYVYEREIHGHKTWVLTVEKHRDYTALYVTLDDNGIDRYGTIIEPRDGRPIAVFIDGLPILELTAA